MGFHLGKPVLVLAMVALVTGGAIALRLPAHRAQLVVWTFVDSHAESYRQAVGRFEAQNAQTVDVHLVNVSAENIRLNAMFDRPTPDVNQPDVVEIEIGSIGRYFRAPVDAIPFLPLKQFLDRDDWRGKFLASRFSPWSKQGVTFGVPHDVHPVSISFRRDLFEQAGVDLPAAKTWPQFQDACLRFQDYWRAHGYPRRSAIELPQTAADELVMMLLQRRVNLLDDRDQLHLEDERVAQTIAFYSQLVTGPRAIAAETTPGGDLWIRDFINGDVCAIFTPDWRAGFLKRDAPSAAGKVAMMPMPIFETGDAPTATWGGTMAAIPRRCRDPESAFKLITFLYSDRDSIERQWRESLVLPAGTQLWTDSVFHQPDPFFSNQNVGELYIELAKQIPQHYWSAFTPIANAQMVSVLSSAIADVKHGVSGEVLLSNISRRLAVESAELKRRIEFGKFE